MMKTRLIGMMDVNLDGKIQKSELVGDVGNAIRPFFEKADTNHDGGIDAKEFEPILKRMAGGGGGRAKTAAN